METGQRTGFFNGFFGKFMDKSISLFQKIVILRYETDLS